MVGRLRTPSHPSLPCLTLALRVLSNPLPRSRTLTTPVDSNFIHTNKPTRKRLKRLLWHPKQQQKIVLVPVVPQPIQFPEKDIRHSIQNLLHHHPHLAHEQQLSQMIWKIQMPLSTISDLCLLTLQCRVPLSPTPMSLGLHPPRNRRLQMVIHSSFVHCI